MDEEDPSPREVLEVLAYRLTPEEHGTLSPTQQKLNQDVLKLVGQSLGVSHSNDDGTLKQTQRSNQEVLKLIRESLGVSRFNEE